MLFHFIRLAKLKLFQKMCPSLLSHFSQIYPSFSVQFSWNADLILQIFWGYTLIVSHYHQDKPSKFLPLVPCLLIHLISCLPFQLHHSSFRTHLYCTFPKILCFCTSLLFYSLSDFTFFSLKTRFSCFLLCNVGDPGSIPRSGRSPGERNGNPLRYSCWKIPWMEKPVGYSLW